MPPSLNSIISVAAPALLGVPLILIAPAFVASAFAAVASIVSSTVMPLRALRASASFGLALIASASKPVSILNESLVFISPTTVLSIVL